MIINPPKKLEDKKLMQKPEDRIIFLYGGGERYCLPPEIIHKYLINKSSQVVDLVCGSSAVSHPQRKICNYPTGRNDIDGDKISPSNS